MALFFVHLEDKNEPTEFGTFVQIVSEKFNEVLWSKMKMQLLNFEVKNKENKSPLVVR